MSETAKPVLLEELILGDGSNCAVIFTDAITEREAELVRQAYELGQKHAKLKMAAASESGT